MTFGSDLVDLLDKFIESFLIELLLEKAALTLDGQWVLKYLAQTGNLLGLRIESLVVYHQKLNDFKHEIRVDFVAKVVSVECMLIKVDPVLTELRYNFQCL